MNVETRARYAKQRRAHVIAAAVIVASATACAHQPPDPVAAPERDVIHLKAVPVQPQVKQRATVKPQPRVTVKPRKAAPAKAPARIGTALSIRHLRVTKYCFEGSPTSLGKTPWVGVAAVKKASGIPYGAHLVIAGKRYVVGDREPPFGVSDVDLYAGRGSSCEREASRFGIQHLAVTIEKAA